MDLSRPPVNPSDLYFLKVCFVCGEIAKSGQTHMRNYGGIVCLGCRQFFRRMHQDEKVKNVALKHQNKSFHHLIDSVLLTTSRYKDQSPIQYVRSIFQITLNISKEQANKASLNSLKYSQKNNMHLIPKTQSVIHTKLFDML